RVSGGQGWREELARGGDGRSRRHASQVAGVPRASALRPTAVSLLLLLLLLPLLPWRAATGQGDGARGRGAHRRLRRPPLPRLPLLPPARTRARSRDGEGARGAGPRHRDAAVRGGAQGGGPGRHLGPVRGPRPRGEQASVICCQEEPRAGVGRDFLVERGPLRPAAGRARRLPLRSRQGLPRRLPPAPLSLPGSVKLRIRWRSAAAEWAEAREAALAAARPLPVPVPPSSLSSRGVVSVRLFSAQELRGADADGLSDPYAEVRLGSRGAVRSSICSRTRDPVWDETFSFGGEVAQLLAEPLAISLYDKDASRLDRDDSLGKATLDLSPLRTQYAAALTGTVLYKRSQPRGQVHAVVSWVSGEEPSGDQAGQQQAGQQQPPSSGGAAQPPPGLQGLRLPAVKLPPRPARLSLGRVGRRQAASIRGQHGASPDGSGYSPSGGSDLAV
ncbi:hypothetical protein EMIHUDRAFT_457794, partial [Emiliania huxleyi CCMP1516]